MYYVGIVVPGSPPPLIGPLPTFPVPAFPPNVAFLLNIGTSVSGSRPDPVICKAGSRESERHHLHESMIKRPSLFPSHALLHLDTYVPYLQQYLDSS